MTNLKEKLDRKLNAKAVFSKGNLIQGQIRPSSIIKKEQIWLQIVSSSENR